MVTARLGDGLRRRLSRNLAGSAGRGALRTGLIYAAIAVGGTAFLFFLHYWGNQTDYDLLRQRFQAEFAAEMPEQDFEYTEGDRRMSIFLWEFCEMSQMALAGAQRNDSDRPLLDAVLLEIFTGDLATGKYYCAGLQAVSSGAELSIHIGKTRYWWGSKALLAIALRYLSVSELYRLIAVATYAAWLLLAAALALLGWRALLVALPVILFGIALPDIATWADTANGIPYLFAVLAAAVLVLLLRRPATARWAPRFCFIIGMASAYLWLFDGHNFLAIALIGLAAWLGYERLNDAGKFRRAGGCLALYVIGFVLCLALGQAVKSVVYESAIANGNDYFGGRVARSFLGQAAHHFDRTVDEAAAGIMAGSDIQVQGCPASVCRWGGWQTLPVIRDIRAFWLLTPVGVPASRVLSVLSALALASAVVFAVYQAWRRRAEPGRSILWLVGLGLLVSLQFVLPDDIQFRSARFVFILLALCWSCFIIALLHISRRQVLMMIAAFVISSLLGLGILSANAERIGDVIENTRPVVSSNFDVYHTGKRLIYHREQCGDADTEPPFFLHIFPVDMDSLPVAKRQHGLDNRDFRFREHQPLFSGGCVAAVRLPDYDILSIRTGQYLPGQGQLWASEFIADVERVADVVANSQPVISSNFNVYYTGSQLIYRREQCGDADTAPPFFLHILPVDPGDLPGPRQQYGYDNHDFRFGERRIPRDGDCVAAVRLPDYDIASIRTGQYLPDQGQLWTGEFRADVERVADVVANSQPVISSNFNVYYTGSQLIYRREQCGDADTAPPFFLHILPVDPGDLPGPRQQYGYDNHDFRFGERRIPRDGDCVAAVRLPEYDIASIRTGQYLPDQGQLWAGEFRPGE